MDCLRRHSPGPTLADAPAGHHRRNTPAVTSPVDTNTAVIHRHGLCDRPESAAPDTGAERVFAPADGDDADELVALDRAECLRLLGCGVLGRVVHTAGALPAVHPVSYTLCRQEIIFRTAQGSILRAAMLRQVLAFEIDDVNPNTRTGWSVLAIGKAHRVTDADRLTALATRLPPSWTTGRPTHTIALPTRLLSGRRLGPVHPTDPWPPTAPTR